MNAADLPQNQIPKHIALILDGNRRWAKQRDLPEIEGHRQGVEKIKPMVERCLEFGVKHVTFWAFSTENWKRSADFVSQIMEVFRETLKKRDWFEELREKGGAIHILGDLSRFPEDVQNMVLGYLGQGKPEPKKIDVNFALNYGGRDEILRAVKKIMKDGIGPSELTEGLFSAYLDTAGQADPDLVIRTGGERRLSGYLPWQTVYAEFVFTNTFWPDFTVAELDRAILDFASRERRFGGDSSKTKPA